MSDELEVEETETEQPELTEAQVAEQEAVEESSKAVAEAYHLDAVNKGLQLKQIRDQEDALIALAEEWLAEQETEEEEPEPETSSDEKEDDLFS